MRPWSYSRIAVTDDCLKQYWYRYIERLPSKRESPAASRGTLIHEKAQKYLDSGSMYPPELQKVSEHAMYLKSKGAKAEVKLAVKDDWTPCNYDDPSAYFRGVIDVLLPLDNVVLIEDWKTGQVYDSHPKQLETYVALVAAHYSDATEYKTRAIYIDLGMPGKQIIHPSSKVKPIRLILDGKIKNVESETIFPLRSGSHCRNCDYSQRYGGPCPH